MVDPHNPINFERNDFELEEWLLFAICVAGKKADVMARKVESFIHDLKTTISNLVGNNFDSSILTPIQMIRYFVVKDELEGTDRLGEKVLKHKLGRYRVILSALRHMAKSDLDLRLCSAERLEEIPGVGPKTSRMFLLHSRRDVRVAVLDTHILAHLRELGHKAPKTTPALKSQYRKLEKIVLSLAEKENLSPEEFDIMIWKKRTKSKSVSLL